MNRILIVEDDPSLGRGLALSLTDGQTQATLVATCREAREQLAAHPFDLALFDVGLPDGSGLDLLQLVRQGSQMPVILVTANDMETDIVTGLTLGADDYITKPFSLAVLRARVANQLRRSRPAASLWQIGPYRFDFEAMEFSREGRPIVLSPTEQKLLRLLVENRGAPCRGNGCWTAFGPMLLLWSPTPCRSRSNGCGTSWRTRATSRPYMAWDTAGRWSHESLAALWAGGAGSFGLRRSDPVGPAAPAPHHGCAVRHAGRSAGRPL